MEPKKMIPGTTSFAIELREIREKAEAARRLGQIEDLQAALECEMRIPGINRTVFRSKTGRHSDMKPDAIPINNRTV